jgi:hypothetical protein
VDVHTEEEFYREISSGDRLVFVGKQLGAQHRTAQQQQHAQTVL